MDHKLSGTYGYRKKLHALKGKAPDHISQAAGAGIEMVSDYPGELPEHACAKSHS